METMEVSATALLSVIILLLFIYRHAIKTFSYWKDRGIPYVSPWKTNKILLDSILSKVHSGELVNLVYSELKDEPCGGFFRLFQPMLVVRDPEVIKTVLLIDFPNFYRNEAAVNSDADPIASRSPLFLGGEKWKKMRSQLSPAFTSGKIRVMFPLIMEVCEELKSHLSKIKPSDNVEGKDLAVRFTTNVVVFCSLGIHAEAIQDPNALFRKMGQDILNTGFWMNLKILSIFLFPSLGEVFRIKLFPSRVVNFFRKVTKDVLKQRKTMDIKRNDFLNLLLQLREKGRITEEDKVDKPVEYSEDDLIAHVMTFFIEGLETSSLALTFTLLELAQNPDVQERLRAEIKSTLQENSGKLDYDIMNKMTYLDMVSSESKRKQPVFNFLTKICTNNCEIETSRGKVKIDAGTPIILPIYSIHRDPKHYPNPMKFDPERFNEENKEKRDKFTYLPFGEGPRACIGMKFAQAQVKAGILSIVKDFEISLSKKTRLPIEYDPSYFFYTVKGGLWLNFKKIS